MRGFEMAVGYNQRRPFAAELQRHFPADSRAAASNEHDFIGVAIWTVGHLVSDLLCLAKRCNVLKSWGTNRVWQVQIATSTPHTAGFVLSGRHLPIQNRPKISVRTASSIDSPVTLPIARAAIRTSVAKRSVG